MMNKIKQTIVIGATVFTGSFCFALAPVATQSAAALECAGVQTSIIGGDACDGARKGGQGTSSGIWAVLLLALNIMTAGVGILAVGGIVYGSVMYASAGDKADQTKKAISIITNVVVGIIAYALMYMGLNFLIPGGIFQ
jgi:hypothetical protein